MATADPTFDRAALATDNRGLAYHFALRYRAAGVAVGIDLDDLVAEALTGLVIAAGRFDPDRGVAFSTYAAFWLRMRVLRAIERARQRRPIVGQHRLPAELADPQDSAAALERRLDLDEILGRLRPRQRKLLVMRFGLDGDGERTLAEVGAVEGVSAEAVRGLADQALPKLREECSKVGFGP